MFSLSFDLTSSYSKVTVDITSILNAFLDDGRKYKELLGI